MLMRCYEGTRNVRMLMTGRGEQAHVGVALLSGFGGANTAKEGEKTTIEESDAEKRARIWTEMQKMAEKQKKLQEEHKADQEYIKKWQMERYQVPRAKKIRRGCNGSNARPYQMIRRVCANLTDGSDRCGSRE